MHQTYSDLFIEPETSLTKDALDSEKMNYWANILGANNPLPDMQFDITKAPEIETFLWNELYSNQQIGKLRRGLGILMKIIRQSEYNLRAPTYDIIKNKIEQEFIKYQAYLQYPDKAKSIASNLLTELSCIQFKDISVELTPSNSIKFKVKLSDDIVVIMSKPFEELIDLREDEIVYNVFLNNEHILSGVKKITELAKNINQLEGAF